MMACETQDPKHLGQKNVNLPLLLSLQTAMCYCSRYMGFNVTASLTCLLPKDLISVQKNPELHISKTYTISITVA